MSNSPDESENPQNLLTSQPNSQDSSQQPKIEFNSSKEKTTKSKKNNNNNDKTKPIQKTKPKTKKAKSQSQNKCKKQNHTKVKRAKEEAEEEETQKVPESEMWMLKEERQFSKNDPKYHFCRFISRHYRLIEDKKDRKNHFMRMQPIFLRYLKILKDNSLPLITIDTFRKYFKKFYKRRGIKYQENANNVDMRCVLGIDRRHNSKFGF